MLATISTTSGSPLNRYPQFLRKMMQIALNRQLLHSIHDPHSSTPDRYRRTDVPVDNSKEDAQE